jgi:hypothetical protein
MATKKQKEELIRTIKNPERYFKVEFGRYGGEVAMGEITKEQFEYWEGKEEEFAEHMASVDWGDDKEDDGTPSEAKFTKPFYEYEDICHTSGPELSDGQTMTIIEVDKDGQPLQDEEGNFLDDRQVDMKDFKKLGVKVKCVAEHNSGSKSCKDKYYMFGQYFNKGGWYSGELVKTGPDGFNLKKVAINYENCDGFKVFSEFEYDGDSFYLEEDSTGKSSSFYVMEGDDV